MTEKRERTEEITVKSVYPIGKPLKFPKSTIYCPLCSTNENIERRRVRFRRVVVPRGLTYHLNAIHLRASFKVSNEVKKRTLLRDVIHKWYKYMSSVSKVSARAMPKSIVGSFERCYDGNVSWKRFLEELVRGVETIVAKSSEDEDQKQASSYKDSLPELHNIASSSSDSNVMKRFSECLNSKSDRLRALLCTDRNGSLCLHWAGGSGNIALVNHIIKEIRRCDDEKLSAYSKVVTSKSTRGVDGRTFLHFAARHGRDELIDHVLQRPTEFTPFYVIPHNNKVDETISVADSQGNEGTTPLMLASYGCHIETIKLLIEKYDANVNARNKWGCSAAHFVSLCASRFDTTKIVQYLHKRGADFTSVQSNGHTPAHKASLEGNEYTIKAIYTLLTPVERTVVSSQRDNDGNRVSDLWSGRDSFRKWIVSVGW